MVCVEKNAVECADNGLPGSTLEMEGRLKFYTSLRAVPMAFVSGICVIGLMQYAVIRVSNCIRPSKHQHCSLDIIFGFPIVLV